MGGIKDVIREANDLLLKIYNLNNGLGSYIKLADIYVALKIDSDDQKKEIRYLVNDVLTQALSYLEEKTRGKTPQGEYKISPKGLIYLNESIHKLSPSNSVFCAMWFNSSTDEIWRNGISPAISQGQFKPIRIDEEHFTEDIIAKIKIHINQCKFVVADLTGQRTAVYYEAGYAQAKGLNVIFTCNIEEKEEINFDVNHYPIIFWEKNEAEALRDRLYSRIVNVCI